VTGLRQLAGRAAAYVVLLLAVLIALFPVFWTVSTSIKDRVTSFAAPGMAATTVFIALLAWNELLTPLMLADERAKTPAGVHRGLHLRPQSRLGGRWRRRARWPSFRSRC
jgi:ABC-type glycerol-3-phosphate transport system permease component